MTASRGPRAVAALQIAAPYLVVLVRRHLDCLYILQLERYRHDRFGRWLAGHVGQLVPRREVVVQEVTVVLAAVAACLSVPGVILYLLWVAGGVLPLRAQHSLQISQRLSWTARAVRVSLASWLVSAVLGWITGRMAGVLLAPWLELTGRLWLGGIVGMTFAGLFMPGSVRLAARLLGPLESTIARRFLREAATRMARYPGKVIGITGSYGKTTTKHIVAALLAARYRVFKTPAGVNTTMGITRIIREELTDEHELFVVEASAYGPGEIREVCDIVHPKLAILTAVGVQHLERFGTPERIAEAKYELIAALPPGGPAVINADDATCLGLAERARTEGKRVLLYGLEERPGLALRGAILGVSRQGTRFRADGSGESAEFATRLLGRWNISNVLAALATGVECGIPLAAMQEAVGAVTPAPRRLEIQEAGGIVRILDVANANPRGAEMALEVLGQFPGGARILITPGMVELGPLEAEENYKFGERAAGVCDRVVLVGPKQTAPIRKGLLDRGFPSDRIVTVRQAEEVADQLASVVQPGDILLYENRLPDTYLEVGP